LPRVFSTVVVLVLLGATAAAFALTEGLKLERTPISKTQVDKVFSPLCGCRTRVAHVSFHLRRGDRLTVRIVQEGRTVRTLAAHHFNRGTVRLAWNGLGDDGLRADDGVYVPVVHFARQHRTITLPNEIQLDTEPPEVRIVGVQPVTFSPDGDGRADRITVRYAASEPAHAIVYVNGKRRVRGKSQQLSGSLQWFGKVNGRAARIGIYQVSVAARDLAGNLSPQTRPVEVRVRYVELGRRVVHAKAGRQFGVRVLTDARTVSVRYASTTFVRPAGLLVLRAGAPGRYGLFVSANGHAVRAEVIVG